MEVITLDLEVGSEFRKGDGAWSAIEKVLAEKPLNKGAFRTIIWNNGRRRMFLRLEMLGFNIFN
ncbi:hypothetical protein COLO4_20512 [Corchorus olitorius]|uniref:Uncharacterized protein n=1 Tax=Corchorus olitorius TaxID=93759 RepID=A0A1R3IZG9_9ROSI|nr:hypothetical protein COLO4_20512 [Corchorus olitorius]